MAKASVDQLRPCPTGRVLFVRVPGGKLPGYYQLVPSARSAWAPVDIFDSTSAQPTFSSTSTGGLTRNAPLFPGRSTALDVPGQNRIVVRMRIGRPSGQPWPDRATLLPDLTAPFSTPVPKPRLRGQNCFRPMAG